MTLPNVPIDSIPAAVAKPARRPTRILLVEDHADTAEILSRLLRRMGCDIIQANSVSGALQAAEREMAGLGLDIVLSDLGLPDGSGLDVIRHAIRKHPACEALVISMFGDEDNVLASIEAGALG